MVQKVATEKVKSNGAMKRQHAKAGLKPNLVVLADNARVPLKPKPRLRTNADHEADAEKGVTECSAVCLQLRDLQRQRIVNLKSRIMIENRLVASIACMNGYQASMDEKERLARFDAARKAIKEVLEGDAHRETELCAAPLIRSASVAIDGFDQMVREYERQMVRLAKLLPVAAWVLKPEQKGFGMLSLAVVVGEAGDLNNYANPGKLWKFMASAPYESDGVMKMPSTWRREGGLSAAEWMEIGYNPRRRSIGYLIGENLVKQNGTGPYRQRYDYAKARAANTHADWKPLRCHRHGMLLATKMIYLRLWCEWTGNDPNYVWRGIG